MITHTTADGYAYTIYGAGYTDWALNIDAPDGKNAFFNPHYLSIEDYGFHWPDGSDGEEWTQEEWAEALDDLHDSMLWNELAPEEP